MALTATIYNIDIDLADADRGVYETLALRVAQHPSESGAYLVTRVLAYALEYTEGIEFSAGLSNADLPAILVRDLTGTVRSWIEVGSPDPARIHKASKSTGRVAIYTGRDPRQLIDRLSGERIHRAETVELHAIDRALVDALAARLERRLSFAMSVAEREIYLSIGQDTLNGAVTRHSIVPASQA
ncbi:MAG: YaeQ family protein [Vicinamibacterales bacterium]